MRRRRLCILAAGPLLVLAVVLVSWIMIPPITASSSQAKHPLVGVSIVHAAVDGKAACGSCHTEPIASATCSSCHPSPPTRITQTKINLIHHDPEKAPPEITCQACHLTGGTDARTVFRPKPDHNFCGSCHSPNHGPSGNSSQPSSGTIDAAQIFAQRCAVCHGANRQGGFGPALTVTALSEKSAELLTGTITNGRSPMPKFGDTLSAAEIDALVQFLKTVSP